MHIMNVDIIWVVIVKTLENSYDLLFALFVFKFVSVSIQELVEIDASCILMGIEFSFQGVICKVLSLWKLELQQQYCLARQVVQLNALWLSKREFFCKRSCLKTSFRSCKDFGVSVPKRFDQSVGLLTWSQHWHRTVKQLSSSKPCNLFRVLAAKSGLPILSWAINLGAGLHPC